MKKYYCEKIFFLQNDSYENLDNFSYFFKVMAFMSRSTPTTGGSGTS